MQIVIEIDEEDFEIMKHNIAVNNPLCPLSQEEMVATVAKGTPLPKGHGRLIDADDAKREWSNVIDCEIEHPKYQCTIRDVLEDAPTVIAVDAESEVEE